MNGHRPSREAHDDTAPSPQPSRPVKRSFSIAGHKTSISLEAAFWDAFRDLCQEEGVALAARIAEIDRGRGAAAGLSGAVRVWILQRYREKAEQAGDTLW